MKYIHRKIEASIKKALKRGKSILLLGPRQTGKTTLVTEQIQPDISYSFAKLSTYQRYEKDPVLLEKELEYQIDQFEGEGTPVIFIDEVQKIPRLMDIAQDLIDRKKRAFYFSRFFCQKVEAGDSTQFAPGKSRCFSDDPACV